MSDAKPKPIDQRKLVSTSLWLAAGFLILLGVAAIVAPLKAAVAVERLLGIVLLLAGVAESLFAWDLRTVGGSVWRILRAACYLLAGVVLLAYPLRGIVTLAFVLGLLFVMEGVLRLFITPQLTRNRNLVVIDGVLGILLGIVILMGWPGDSAWIIGTLVGIRLILTAIVLLMIGSAIRPTATRT